ncbi:MAG: HD domain-containing protein [Lachnospiraceae bacterium]|nr:HD domain-containing protein [Lachnospiraceae bacterium]
MSILYGVCIFLSVALCFWYFLVDVRRSIVQNIMFITMLVANLGYLSMELATDLSGAVMSNNITYVGACFMPFLFFLTVCEVCHVRLSALAVSVMIGIQAFLYFCVCSAGYLGIYYKSMEFVVVNGRGMLNKVYGPLHFLYPLSLYSYMFAGLVIAVYAVTQKKNVHRMGLVVMVICEFIASISYIIQRMIHNGYDFTPVIYILMMTGSIIPIYQSDLFNVDENDAVIKEQLRKVGFLTVDNKMRYMGANEYAMEVFPDLKKLYLGDKFGTIPAETEALYEDVRNFLDSRSKEKGHHHKIAANIVISDRTYSTEIHTLKNFMGKCVGITLEIRDITEHTRVLELTEKYNEELSKEVEKKTERIRDIQEKTILGMAQMVESRDLSTGGHIKRTSEVVNIFTRKLQAKGFDFEKHFLELVVRSAPMHDIGKIGVDDAVLRKQGRFEPEEYEKMKKHSEIGGRMVKDILAGVEEEDFVRIAFNVANYHHEKVNGQGYPCGLKGDEIPVEARIMALADVFDALVSKRCYKDAYSYDKAFNIIKEDAGTHFDEKLAAVFLECREELEDYYNLGEI